MISWELYALRFAGSGGMQECPDLARKAETLDRVVLFGELAFK